MVLPLHVGFDHLPWMLILGLVVFVGAVALRGKLERWVGEDKDGAMGSRFRGNDDNNRS